MKQGDALDSLKSMESDSIDSLVTDPPAGISFMGKDWDSSRGGREPWIVWMSTIMEECYRVLKPGAHGLVWALPRTSHWTATALENAGFQIRDVVTHVFGTGFPKSHNLEKSAGLKGFGTALKPASEHWILVRKPLSEKTVAANVLMHGTGGINIDACRIEGIVPSTVQGQSARRGEIYGKYQRDLKQFVGHDQGRFPANLVLDEVAAEMLGEPARFFYCAKASRKDRNEGLEGMPEKLAGCMSGPETRDDRPANHTMRANFHPTVKSTKLMEYLITLVTPPNGTVLDPFMGSGSTGVAAKRLGFQFVGIEQEPEYFQIAEKRIKGAS